MIFRHFLLVLLLQPGWQSGLPSHCWNTRLAGEPPPPGPGLHAQLSSTAEIILVEDLLHLPIPFGEKILSGRLVGGSQGKLSQVDSVEILQPGTAVESSQVDDAQAGSVNPPVVLLASLVSATVPPGTLGPGVEPGRTLGRSSTSRMIALPREHQGCHP